MRYVEGVLTEITGDLATVVVAVQEGGCGRCHEVGGCGSQNLSRALCGKRREIQVPHVPGAKIGERVRVGMDDLALGALATRVYVVPLVGMLLGALAGQALFDAGAWGGVIGAFGGFLGAYWCAARWCPASMGQPKMIRCHEATPADGK